MKIQQIDEVRSLPLQKNTGYVFIINLKFLWLVEEHNGSVFFRFVAEFILFDCFFDINLTGMSVRQTLACGKLQQATEQVS